MTGGFWERMRKVLGIRWTDKKKVSWVRGEREVEFILMTNKNIKWSCADYIIRRTDGRKTN